MSSVKREEELFEVRSRKWSSEFGEQAGFVLAAVRGAQERIANLGAAGTLVVAIRTGAYRHWDAETLAVDQLAEQYYLERIQQQYGGSAVVLTEEAARVPSHGQPSFYIVSDPFDGSALYKRHLPGFAYTALAVYSAEGIPLAAAVCDTRGATVTFANAEHAFSARFVGDDLVQVAPAQPSHTATLHDAVLETYLMKIPRLFPAVEIWKPLLAQTTFVLPNGGPAGFTDVASGRVDIYLALEEDHTENFSALPIAWAAGAIVTDLDGKRVHFEDNIGKRYFILCTANPRLHDLVLEEIRKIDWKRHPHYAKILAEQ